MPAAHEPWMEELLNAGTDGERMTEKQARIFEAAVEVFAEKGYSASSTSEIAQRAGVAEGTIFRHYKTKKDLLIAIVAPAMVRLLAPFVLREFNDVLQSEYDDVESFLQAMIENRIAFLERNKRFLKIMLQELPFHPELQESLKSIVFSRLKERFEVIIGRLQAKGLVVDLPTPTVMRLAASTLMGYVLIRTFYGMREGVAWDDETERRATIDYIMKGLAPDK